jgi:hypothetical protein
LLSTLTLVALLSLPPHLYPTPHFNRCLPEESVMTFDTMQFRSLIQRVLQEMDIVIPYSEAARELLMLTAAQESHLGKYLKQDHGPARGVFQMEPATLLDLQTNYLKHNPNIRMMVDGFRCSNVRDTEIELQGNLAYQIAMARVFYYRIKAPLPPAHDVEALAGYWKKFYNTHLGKGTVEEAVFNYSRFCGLTENPRG